MGSLSAGRIPPSHRWIPRSTIPGVLCAVCTLECRRTPSPSCCAALAVPLSTLRFAPSRRPYVAHGFQTLTDDSEVLYQMGSAYVPDSARGVRFDDPAFAIEWPPAASRIVSERDSAFPDFAG